MSSRHIILTLLLSLQSLGFQGARANTVVGDTPLVDNPHVSLGLPPAINREAITISRKQYVIQWNPETRTPSWVAWGITKRYLGNTPRTDSFRIDGDLEEALLEQGRQSVEPTDYQGSCIDRGHQVPSADRTSTELDNKSTFYMSNMLPQSAHLNRKTWVSLERFLRRLVMERGFRVQIYAGAISRQGLGYLGPNEDILVPERNFKIAVVTPPGRGFPSKAQSRLLAVNFPNVTSRGTNPVTDRAQACWDSEHTLRLDESNRQAYWRPYLSTLRNVQWESHIDFSFLKGIQEFTPSEVDDLIVATGAARLSELSTNQIVSPLGKLFSEALHLP